MSDEPVIKPEAPMRDALIIYALLSRLGKKCTKNEVLEAVSASAAELETFYFGNSSRQTFYTAIAYIP